MLGSNEVNIEWSSLVIFGWDYEISKEPLLLELKDNIMEGDKLWLLVGYSESICDGIRVGIFNKNSEVILLEISDSSKLSLSNNAMVGVIDFSRLGESLGCKEPVSLGVS